MSTMIQNSQRFLGAFVFLLAGNMGCAGKPVDPLAADRAELLALQSHSPSADSLKRNADWQAEAGLLVGKELLLAQLRAALPQAMNAAAKEMTAETALGAMQLTPHLQLDDVHFLKVAGCSSCVEVAVQLSGDVEVMLEKSGGFLSSLISGSKIQIPVEGKAVATLEIRSEKQISTLADGQEQRTLQVKAYPQQGTWQISFSALDLPQAFADEVNTLLEKKVSESIRDGKFPPLQIAELQEEGAVRIREVRVRPGRTGLLLEVAFLTLSPGKTVDLDVHPAGKTKGWVAAISAQTLLELARVSALMDEAKDEFVVEPVGIALNNGLFTLQIRLWRVQAEPDFRAFEVKAEVGIDNAGKLKIEPVSSREIGEGAGFSLNPAQLVVRHAVLAKLSNALDQVLPTKHVKKMGATSVETTVERVFLDDNTLFIYGTTFLRPSN
ncbi:MAG: hypothetical protein GY822_28800 [Deltaproteobacteria bacterium]|nr:hypothetical protein [Deltaproteobacteria bacterium]